MIQNSLLSGPGLPNGHTGAVFLRYGYFFYL